jgi:hypothetical protein
MLGTGCGRVSAAAAGAAPVNLGPFAGYAQIGPVVSSVSATLTVPRINPSSAVAGGGTWIGAEQLGPDGLHEPFIQVGVNEIAPGRRRPAVYYTFWTDTARGFRAFPLFRVRAGERVSVRLALSDQHWIVSIADGAVHRRIVTAQEGQALFDEALWIQEDISEGVPFHLAPYPKLAAPRISDLSVDGAPPQPSKLNAEWMSVGAKVFEPTVTRHDAFVVAARRSPLPASMVRALRALRSENEGLLKPQLQLAGATAATPRTKEIRWASEVAEGVSRIEAAARDKRWPRKLRSSIKTMIDASGDLVSLTRLVAHVSAADFAAWQLRWGASVTVCLVATADLLRAEHLPEVAIAPPRV